MNKKQVEKIIIKDANDLELTPFNILMMPNVDDEGVEVIVNPYQNE